MGIEEKVQERVDTLLRYRDGLDGSERELFDLLMGYANEIARSMDREAAGMGYSGS
jgi:hypothetical protein